MHASKYVAGGVKTAAVETYMAGKEGTRVVVRYTEKGADKTAVGVEDFGKDALKESKGTVTHVDKAARTVAVKTEDGAETTYTVSKDATIDGWAWHSQGIGMDSQRRRQSDRPLHGRRREKASPFIQAYLIG